MTPQHISISGVSVADGVSRERAKEIYSLHDALREVRGVGYKTAAKIVAEYPSRDGLLDAGVDGISDVEGVGRTTANQIVDLLSQDGWDGEITVTIESDPEDREQYTVTVGNYRTESGSSLIPTLTQAMEGLPTQRVIDDLRD